MSQEDSDQVFEEPSLTNDDLEQIFTNSEKQDNEYFSQKTFAAIDNSNNDEEDVPNFGGIGSKIQEKRLSYHNLDAFTKMSTHQEITQRRIDYDLIKKRPIRTFNKIESIRSRQEKENFERAKFIEMTPDGQLIQPEEDLKSESNQQSEQSQNHAEDLSIQLHQMIYQQSQQQQEFESLEQEMQDLKLDGFEQDQSMGNFNLNKEHIELSLKLSKVKETQNNHEQESSQLSIEQSSLIDFQNEQERLLNTQHSLVEVEDETNNNNNELRVINRETLNQYTLDFIQVHKEATESKFRLVHVEKFSRDALAILNTSFNVEGIELYKQFNKVIEAKRSKIKNQQLLPREMRQFMKVCKERKLYKNDLDYDTQVNKYANIYNNKRQTQKDKAARTLRQKQKASIADTNMLESSNQDNNMREEGDQIMQEANDQ